MATIIKANGEKVFDNKTKAFTLEEAQKIVGGYVEVVYLNHGRIMLVNEEGRLFGLPVNVEASRILNNERGGSKTYIVGDVLICNNEQFQ